MTPPSASQDSAQFLPARSVFEVFEKQKWARGCVVMIPPSASQDFAQFLPARSVFEVFKALLGQKIKSFCNSCLWCFWYFSHLKNPSLRCCHILQLFNPLFHNIWSECYLVNKSEKYEVLKTNGGCDDAEDRMTAVHIVALIYISCFSLKVSYIACGLYRTINSLQLLLYIDSWVT